jgi:hypothetical protein
VGSKQQPERIFRLLLDQGFPKPPGFNPESVDKHIEVVHLSQWNEQLSRNSTPDWIVYCEAALDGFDALVTRDFSQADLEVEMYTLTRLARFHLITFREGVEDPIAEWGQVMAYMPLVRRVLETQPSRVIRLPKPTLSNNQNVFDPRHFLDQISKKSNRSDQEVRHSALNVIREAEEILEAEGRYTRLFERQRRRKKPPSK